MVTSKDGGLSFSEPIQLDNDQLSVDTWRKPALIADDDFIHTCFSGKPIESNETSDNNVKSDIFYTKFPKETEAKNIIIRVNDDIDKDNRQICPAMTIDDDNNIYFVWIDNRDDGSDTIFFSMINEEYALMPNKKVGGFITTYSTGPSIAVWNNSIYVVWRDDVDYNPVVLSYSNDDGNSFSIPGQLNTNATNNYCANPEIIISNNGTLFISWSASSKSYGNHYPKGIYFIHSLNNETVFSDNIELGNYRIFYDQGKIRTISSQSDPSFSYHNNTLHFLYRELRFDHYYYYNEEFAWGNPVEYALPSVSYQKFLIN